MLSIVYLFDCSCMSHYMAHVHPLAVHTLRLVRSGNLKRV